MISSFLVFVTSVMGLATCTIVPFRDFVGNNGFGGSTEISQSCAAALNNTIECDLDLYLLALTDTYISPNATSDAAGFCAAGCNSSLASYLSSVAAQCGDSPVIEDDLPNTFLGNLLQSVWSMMCTRDSGTGQFCPGLYPPSMNDVKVAGKMQTNSLDRLSGKRLRSCRQCVWL